MRTRLRPRWQMEGAKRDLHLGEREVRSPLFLCRLAKTRFVILLSLELETWCYADLGWSISFVACRVSRLLSFPFALASFCKLGGQMSRILLLCWIFLEFGSTSCVVIIVDLSHQILLVLEQIFLRSVQKRRAQACVTHDFLPCRIEAYHRDLIPLYIANFRSMIIDSNTNKKQEKFPTPYTIYLLHGYGIMESWNHAPYTRTIDVSNPKARVWVLIAE